MSFDDALGQLFLLSDDMGPTISEGFMSQFGDQQQQGPTDPGSGTIFDPNFQPETFFGELGGGEGGTQRDFSTTGELGGSEDRLVRFGEGFQSEAASRRNALRSVLESLGLPDPRTDPNAFTLGSGKRARFNEDSGTFQASSPIETTPGGGAGGSTLITNVGTAPAADLSDDELTELRQARGERTRAQQALSPALLQVLQRTAARGATSTEELTRKLQTAAQAAQTIGPEQFLSLQTAAEGIARKPEDVERTVSQLFLREEGRQRTESRQEEERGAALEQRETERQQDFERKRELAETVSGQRAKVAEAKKRTSSLRRKLRNRATSLRAAARARHPDDAAARADALAKITERVEELDFRIGEGDVDDALLDELGIKGAAKGKQKAKVSPLVQAALAQRADVGPPRSKVDVKAGQRTGAFTQQERLEAAREIPGHAAAQAQLETFLRNPRLSQKERVELIDKLTTRIASDRLHFDFSDFTQTRTSGEVGLTADAALHLFGRNIKDPELRLQILLGMVGAVSPVDRQR